MKQLVELLLELGPTIAAAIAMGIFIYIIIKYILSSVVGQAKTLHSIITQLENRVETMNNDMIKIDLLVSESLDLRPDIDRVARNENFIEDGKIDSRRD